MINKRLGEFSKKLTRWIGSVPSVIVHTIFFSSIFVLGFSGLINPDYVFAFTTNILSIEAIYLAIFIQMTVNRHSEDLEEVSEDIDEIQKDVEEISEDVDEIQKDVEEISDEDQSEEEADRIEINKFKHIEDTLQALLQEISELKRK